MNILIGGTGDDAIDGRAARPDLRRSCLARPRDGVSRDPRFEDLTGAQLSGHRDCGPTCWSMASRSSTRRPDLGDYLITIVGSSYGAQLHLYGNDYHQQPADDTIFGELSTDTIQGDSSISFISHPIGDLAIEAERGFHATGGHQGATAVAPARRGPARRSNYLLTNPSVDRLAIAVTTTSRAPLRRSGQDDIIGGNSEVFGLGGACTAAMARAGKRPGRLRPDLRRLHEASDAGRLSAASRPTPAATRRPRVTPMVSDTITDNGDTYRIVAVAAIRYARGLRELLLQLLRARSMIVELMPTTRRVGLRTTRRQSTTSAPPTRSTATTATTSSTARSATTSYSVTPERRRRRRLSHWISGGRRQRRHDERVFRQPDLRAAYGEPLYGLAAFDPSRIPCSSPRRVTRKPSPGRRAQPDPGQPRPAASSLQDALPAARHHERATTVDDAISGAEAILTPTTRPERRPAPRSAQPFTSIRSTGNDPSVRTQRRDLAAESANDPLRDLVPQLRGAYKGPINPSLQVCELHN